MGRSDAWWDSSLRCFHPVDAWQTDSGAIVFSDVGGRWRPLRLRCGQCVGCRLSRSCAWALRCMHEASLHSQNCFITLTYDDVNVPDHGTLVYWHFQRFMKRLRKRYGAVRFFMCGEYGAEHFRPHFHACLFGVDFPDRVLFRRSESGCDVFISQELQALWPYGFSSIGNVTFESAAYVARYVMKKVTGTNADGHYMRVDCDTGEVYSLEPEFCHMSLKPGIGREWIDKFKDEVFVHDGCIVNGSKFQVPRYYQDMMKSFDRAAFDDIEWARYLKRVENEVRDEYGPERLAVQETVALAKLGFLKRGEL